MSWGNGAIANPLFQTRYKYIPVRSAMSIRPPWMAEVEKMQEQFSALVIDGLKQRVGNSAYRAPCI